MDKSYWDSFYKDRLAVNFPSSFAEFCIRNYIPKNSHIIELGSGNGRDAFYFLENQHDVVAIDQSTSVLEIEKNKLALTTRQESLEVVQGDFVEADLSKYDRVNVVYSRFTLHAIGLNEEKKAVDNVYSALPKEGLFLIEARTTRDPLCGVGEHIEGNTYKTDHSRRFVNTQSFLSSVLRVGFKLVYFIESAGLSVYKDEDPVLMRIVLKKTDDG